MAISNVSSGARPGVCTSTTRPQNPYEGFVIYETDTNLVRVWSGSVWVETSSMLTKAPRGIMGNSTLSTTKSFGSTDTDSGLSVTWTAVSNRLYKLSFSGQFTLSASGQVIAYISNSANSNFWERTMSVASNDQFCISGFVTQTGLSGSVTYKVRLYANTGTGILYGASSRGSLVPTFTVEDIGEA